MVSFLVLDAICDCIFYFFNGVLLNTHSNWGGLIEYFLRKALCAEGTICIYGRCDEKWEMREAEVRASQACQNFIPVIQISYLLTCRLLTRWSFETLMNTTPAPQVYRAILLSDIPVRRPGHKEYWSLVDSCVEWTPQCPAFVFRAKVCGWREDGDLSPRALQAVQCVEQLKICYVI